MLVGGAAVRPDVCHQSTTVATVRLVCILSSPLPEAGLTVERCGPCLGYLHTSRLVVLHITQGGSTKCTGAGGAGSAPLAIGGSLQEGPCSTGREAGPLEGWIHRSTALGVCVVQASLVMGTGSLWNFVSGVGEGDGACQCLCSPLS